MLQEIIAVYIEDNPGDQALMENFLSKTSEIHVDLSIAGNLKDGLHLIKTLRPHLVLVDLGLPDCNEDETLKRLNQVISKEAVIVISNNQNPKTMFGSLKHGVQEYLFKDKLNSFELEKSIYFSLERKATENKLLSEQKQYQSLFQLNPESILISRVSDGRIVSTNKNFEQVFGWSAEECIGKSAFDINLWSDINERNRIFDDLSKLDEVKRFETTFNTKNGRSIPCSSSFNLYTIDDELYLMGNIVSLSDLHDHKQKLGLEKERFRALVESGPDLFFYTQQLDYLDYISPQVEEHLGYNQAELQTFDYKDLFTNSSLRKFREIELTEFLKQKEDLVLSPFELKCKDGKIKQYELRLIPVAGIEGEKVLFVQGVARDISDEIETFELLERSNNQNIKALDELKTHQYAIDQHNMVLITDLHGKVKFANENFCKRSGFKASELIGQNTRILNSGFHDESFWKDLWDTVLEAKVWKGHVCNRHKNGSLYWLATTIIPRLTADGKIDEFIALRTDITDLKRTEEALMKSESDLRNVLDSNPHEIWSVDKEFCLVSFNKVFAQNFKKFFNHELRIGEDMTDIKELEKPILERWKDRYNLAFKGHTKTYNDVYPVPSGKYDNKHVTVTIYPTFGVGKEVNGAGVFSQDISEKIRAKEDLRESNLRLQKAQSQAKIGDWNYQFTTGQFFWSKNLNSILDLKEEFGTINDVLSLQSRISEEHKDLIHSSFQRALEGDGDQTILVEFKSKEDKGLWLECSFNLESDLTGKPLIIRGVIRNVDDLMQAQKKENLQKQLFIKLADNGPSLLKLNSISDVYQSLVQSLFDWFEQEVVVVSGHITETNSFEINTCKVSIALQQEFEFLEAEAKKGKSYTALPEVRASLKDGKAFQIKKELIPSIPFIKQSRARDLIARMPHFSLVAIGLFYQDQLRGSCYVLFPKGLSRSYSDQMMEILANQASTVMDLISKRNDLKHNSLILNQALEASQSAIWHYDLEADELTGDKRLYEMIELKNKGRNALKVKDLENRYDEKYFSSLEEVFKPSNDERKDYYRLEYGFRCFDGSLKYFEDRAKIVKRDKDGSPIEIIGIRTDISNRKHREEQLLLLESSVKNANEGILITDASVSNFEGPKIVFANDAMSKISGYSVNELIGKTPKVFQGPLTDPVELKKMSSAFARHEMVKTEIVNYTKDGSPYYISLSIVPIMNKEDEVTHFVALERDITEERKQKEAIQEYLTRFELITRISKIGIYDIDPKTEKVNWDTGMYQLYEQNPQKFELNIENWNALETKDSRSKNLRLFKDSLASKLDEFNSNFTIRCASGIKHIHAIARIFRDEKGKPTKIVGLNWDISELEKRRLELDRLRLNTQSLINSTSDHMWSIDLRYRLLSANESYLEYLNTLGNKDFKLKDNMLDPAFGIERNKKWKKLYDRALLGEKVNVELRENNLNAEPQVLVISMYPIRNTHGLITGIACYSFDNTENVQFTETIQKQNKSLKEIAWMQSHVMRAPVARVLGLIELLKEEDQGELSDSVREILNFIQDSSEEMDEVIREITSKTDSFGISLE